MIREASAIVVVLLVILASILLPQEIVALDSETSYLGPFGGRNMYAPHLPWFSFPARKAAAEDPGTVRLRNSLYFLNEFSAYPFDADDAPFSGEEQDNLSALDYESSIWETGIDWQPHPEWSVSVDWRLHFRYGGYFDSIIEWWHSGFGVPNAGREFFPRNRSYWNIRTAEGQSFSGEGLTPASGDMDISTVWSFYSGDTLNLAGSAAMKLPVGKKAGGFSSGYPDFGIAFLLDWRPWKSDAAAFARRWVFFVNAGLIVPTGPIGRLMWQLIPAVEFTVNPKLSVLLQMNLQRSPIIGDLKFVHPIFGNTTMFALPQTDIKIGLKGESGRIRWQFYIEEDPLSWEGPDLLAFMELSILIR